MDLGKSEDAQLLQQAMSKGVSEPELDLVVTLHEGEKETHLLLHFMVVMIAHSSLS